MIGARVLLALRDSEGVGLSFDGDWHLSIGGHVRVMADGMTVDQSGIDGSLEGRALVEFVGDSSVEHLVFSGEPRFELVVSLDLAKCRGPEAMMLRGPNDLIVVWNELTHKQALAEQLQRD
jgi:hypothetical protein